MNEQTGEPTAALLTVRSLSDRTSFTARTRGTPDDAHPPGSARPRERNSSADSVCLPRLVDIHEIAGHLGVSVRHVRRLVAERRIPYVKWGNLLRFNPQQISKWLTQRTVDPLIDGRRRAIRVPELTSFDRPDASD